jgi:hypothetical protein
MEGKGMEFKEQLNELHKSMIPEKWVKPYEVKLDKLLESLQEQEEPIRKDSTGTDEAEEDQDKKDNKDELEDKGIIQTK